MAFAYLLPIRLASTNTGLTLNAILEDETGASINFADATSEKLTGFDEKGNGEYTFYTDQFPDTSFPFTCIIRNDADDSFLASASFNEADVFSDMTKISGDSAAADALEAVLDGTGATMTLDQLRIAADNTSGAIYVTNTNASGPAVNLSAGGVGPALQVISFEGAGMSIVNSEDTTAALSIVGGAGISISANPSILVSGETDLNGLIDTDTIAQITAGIWNALIATYSGTAGSTAEALANTATAADIAALGGSSLTIVTAVNGNKITVYESDTWSFTISGLGDISGYEVIAFGVKATPSVTDATATLLVRSDDGLIAIGGDAPVSAANGTVTPGSGSIAVKIAMSETPVVTAGNYLWWIKGYDTTPSPSEGYTLATGSFCVAGSGVDSITP